MQQATQMATGFSEFRLPDKPRRAVQRHQKHLDDFVVRHRSVGVTEGLINQSKGQLLEAYRPKLAQAIGARENTPNA